MAEPAANFVTSKSMSVELASKLAWNTLNACRKKGYSVAVAVVDRSGIMQTFLRDRFAGPHTVDTAFSKAWTANSLRQDTDELADLHKKGVLPHLLQHNPGLLLVGGGNVIRAAGEVVGAIGVSGAPPGKTEAKSIDGDCAREGLATISETLEFGE
jgi:uncharacterized protein GlcG (DUF336 family)